MDDGSWDAAEVDNANVAARLQQDVVSRVFDERATRRGAGTRGRRLREGGGRMNDCRLGNERFRLPEAAIGRLRVVVFSGMVYKWDCALISNISLQ